MESVKILIKFQILTGEEVAKGEFLLESGQVWNGRLLFWEFHWERVRRSVGEIWPELLTPSRLRELEGEIKKGLETLYFSRWPAGRELVRGRVLYSPTKVKVELERLGPRQFQKFKVVEVGDLDYHLKWANREKLEELKRNGEGADEVIILKNRLVTDTTISNLAFWDWEKGVWITPATPLLRGTTRERLLRRGVLKEAKIGIEELPRFNLIGMLNGVMGFLPIWNPIYLNLPPWRG
ncbi:MAG: aminotransferase class IV [Campylobacterales bacterium]